MRPPRPRSRGLASAHAQLRSDVNNLVESNRVYMRVVSNQHELGSWMMDARNYHIAEHAFLTRRRPRQRYLNARTCQRCDIPHRPRSR